MNDARFRAAADTARQDWDAIAGWLAAQGLRLDRDVEPRQFAGGLANLNYLISVGDSSVVFRRPPEGPAAEGANDMAREARVLSSLSDHYLLAPRSVGFCDDITVIGSPFQLVEYRAGDAIGGMLPPELSDRTDVPLALTAALVDAMASLHALDPAAVGLGDLGKPDGFLRRQVEGWVRRADVAYDDEPPAAVTAIADALRRNLPAQSEVSLLHLDLKFDNLLIDVATLSPVAVVDWDMCTRGDPLFDLAVLASYWVDPSDPVDVQGIAQVPSLEPGFPSRDELVRRYFIAVGREPVDIGFHLALARLRLAIAWQQLYQRWAHGVLAGDRYQAFEVLARSVLDWTADTLSGF